MKRLIILGLLLTSLVGAQTRLNISRQGRVEESTVAALPASNNWAGRLFIVTDGSSSSDCTTGGGANRVLCEYNGSAWASLGGGGGGGGASALNDLSDVTITSAATGEVLRYSGSAWVDAQLAFSDLSGAATDAQVPNNITIDLATAATALAANGGNCSAGQWAAGVDASGASEGCTVDDDVPDAGDFGAATDLDANGAVNADAITTTKLADGVDTPVAGQVVVVATATTDVEYVAQSAIAAGTASALAANGTNCTANQFNKGVDASGNAESCAALLDADVPDTITLTNLTQVTNRAITDTTGDLPLTTRTSGNYVASVATTAPVTGGAAGSEGATLTLGLTQNAGTDVTADLEEEGQINATVVTGNAADDQVITGSGASAAAWKTIPDCNTNNMLTYTQATNTWGCDADDGAGGGAPIGATYITLTNDATLSAERLHTAGTGIAQTDGGANNPLTVALKYSDTIAANPALNAEEVVFTTDGAAGGGFISEGSVADAFEGLFLLPDVTGADSTQNIVTDTATQTLSSKTLTTPTIGSFANATHNHEAAAGGGTIAVAALNNVNAGSDLTADLEEEGQINATAVTGNAADDQLLLGSGASAATYASVPSCSNGTTDKLLYNTATNTFSCGTDQTGAGGGDAIEVEDGDNGGTFSAVNTTAQFEDSGDINFVLAGAGAPHQVSGVVRADSVALTTDTTGNYVASVATTAPITGGAAGSEGATLTLALTQDPGTDVTQDLEEETHASEHTGSAADEIDNRLHARHFSGGDCGAKINAALTAGGSTAHVDVDQACGTTISTAVTITAFQLVHFVECGTWTQSAIITGGNIEGVGNGSPWGPTRGDGCVQLFQANTTNLAQMIRITTDAAAVRNVELDGNTTNNTTSDGIFVDGAASVEIENVLVKEMPDDGIYVKSTTTANNDAQGVQLKSVRAFDNDGDGLHVEDAQDPFISMSGFEGNGIHGIFLENSGAMRLHDSDMAGNVGDCLNITGANTGLDSGLNIIVGNQCGNLVGDGIVIDGHDGVGRVADKNVINGNTFWTSASITANTYDAIRLEGSQDNVVEGNHIQSHGTGTLRYGINATDTTNSGVDVWANNTFSSTFGTAEINPVSTKTVYVANHDNVSTFGNHISTRTDSIFVECEGASANCLQFQGTPNISFLGLTWNLGAVNESGVTANALFHHNGHFASRVDNMAGGNFVFDSGAGFNGTLDHAITAARTWTFPDAAGTVALTSTSAAAGDISGSVSAGYTIDSGAVGATELADTYHTVVKDITLESPTTAEDGDIQIKFPGACTLTRVSCNVAAATSVTINLYERTEGAPNTGTTNMITTSPVCTTTGDVETVFTDSAVAANAPVALGISAVSGTPGWLRVHVACQLN